MTGAGPRAMIAIARRELGSLFLAPAGWIILSLFVLMTGVVFSMVVLTPGRPASMRAFFEAAGWVLLPVAPAISMRMFAEEFRTGTAENLLASPARTAWIVLGKYTGGAAFLLAMLAPTLAYPLVLTLVSEPAPDAGAIIAGYASLVLLGLLALALGLACSAATGNATLAFIVTLFLLLGLLLAGALGRRAPAGLREAAEAIALTPRLSDFARGVIDTAHIAYFASLAALACCVAGLLVDRRRWS